MIYEWRTYEATTGKLPALHTHLEVAAGLFQKHGLGVVGFWIEEIGTGGQVTYMWKYDTFDERQKKLAAFASDDAWKKQVAEETAKEGVIVARIHNTMLLPTPYSPEPQHRTKVQEWRVYDAAPGRLPDLHNRFANHTLGLFAKHGITSIGYWTEAFGTSNRLVYMLGYPSLGDREKSWASFMTDPVWLQARAESEKNGPLVAKVQSTILRATAYSPKG
jgi:hypothetical protein